MRPELIGALHGPLELLPVSSSAHLLLRAERAHGEDVALHLGSGLAMAPFEWRGIRDRLPLHLAAAGVPAVVGALADPFVERRLGGPRSLAAGLLAGSAALAVADARPGVPRPSAYEGLLLGLAQACALWPGVSRTGAVLTAARVLGHERPEAARLARETAVPVVLGAAAFKALRSPWTATTARATALSFASTLAARPLARLTERPLWPFALYRAGLALAVVRGSRDR
jgi:undecaprenyl-diphosphatase